MAIERITDNKFELVSKYEPAGDQGEAIAELVDNIENGEKAQILRGATGTGKTYTMSQVIARTGKPTLVMAHNKTLAGQLYSEFKEFFQIMQSSISYPTMIIINPKPMFQVLTPILKKTVRSMMKLINCVIVRPQAYWNVMM